MCATLVPARVADAVERIRAIETNSAKIHTPAHRLLLAQVLFTRTMSGAPRAGILDLAQRIWDDGRLLRDEGAESHSLWHVIGALSWADAYGSALDAIAGTLEAADGRGLALAHSQARYARAWPYYWMGARRGSGDARAAIEIWHGAWRPTCRPRSTGSVWPPWSWASRVRRAGTGSRRCSRALAGDGMMGFIHALQGHLHFFAGRMEEALACQQACGEVMNSLMIVNPGVMPWRTHAARAMRGLGRLRRRALAEEELELARASGGPRAVGVALTTVGMCTTGPAAIAHLTEGVEVLAALGRARACPRPDGAGRRHPSRRSAAGGETAPRGRARAC